jgi:hypothetical protein
MAVEDLKSKLLPITSITLKPTTNETLDLLLIAQGYQSSTLDHGDPPMLSIYYLRHQRSDYKFLSHVRPPMSEDALSTRGEVLSASISEDDNGIRVHCAFSIHSDQGQLRSNLTTVQINDMDVEELSVIDLTAAEGGTLCDISPQTNSYELSLLYLGKIVNYVQDADAEWDRKESEWNEGQETIHKDPIPAYGSFFNENSKFNYSDAELTEIEQRRQQLGGKLFYDRLLEFVDIEGTAQAFFCSTHHFFVGLFLPLYSYSLLSILHSSWSSLSPKEPRPTAESMDQHLYPRQPQYR